MASKTGNCSLTKDDRAKLLTDLHKSGDVYQQRQQQQYPKPIIYNNYPNRFKKN